MNTFKKKCIELRKRDFTLNEIMQATGKGKSSIYYYIKDIPLSEAKTREINRKLKCRAVELAIARRGKALTPYKPFSKWTPEFVLLIAHLLFDGEISRSRCAYNNRSLVLIERIQQLMKFVYDYPGYRHLKKGTDVLVIAFNNVELGSFLKEKSLELLECIDSMPLRFQREFLRAFFDDEGCMDFRKERNTRRIRGYQNDRTILLLVQALLANFRIKSRLQGRNEVVITGKDNLKRFQKEINFSKGVCINGGRKNSTWKKDIEKRELLDMAIKSFKT